MKLGHKTSNFSPRFRHPTSDISLRSEHYCYFDDMYSPEFTMQWIYEAIQKHDIDAESLALLEDGHKEVLHSECYVDYGYPSYINR